MKIRKKSQYKKKIEKLNYLHKLLYYDKDAPLDENEFVYNWFTKYVCQHFKDGYCCKSRQKCKLLHLNYNHIYIRYLFYKPEHFKSLTQTTISEKWEALPLLRTIFRYLHSL